MQQKLLEWETYYVITYFNYCIASVDGHTPPAQLKDTVKEPALHLSSLLSFPLILRQVLYTSICILLKHTTPDTEL